MEKSIRKLMFTGDSVTDCGRLRPLGDGFAEIGDSYVADLFKWTWVDYPEIHIRFQNSATSGDSTRKLLARFDADVIAHRPDFLMMMIGINDARSVFWDNMVKPEYQLSPEQSEKNMDAMLQKCLAAGIATTILSPLFFDLNPSDPIRQRRDELSDRFRALAERYAIGFLDVQAGVDAYMKRSTPYLLSDDRFHPTPIGKTLIAKIVYTSPIFRKILDT